MATVSGTVSEATGGKFANGAMTGAFVHMFNGELHAGLNNFMIQANASRGDFIIIQGADYSTSGTTFLEDHGDTIGLCLSGVALIAPPTASVVLGLAAIGIDLAQPDYAGVGVGTVSTFMPNKFTKSVDIIYGVSQMSD